jgi:hypothetical protein
MEVGDLLTRWTVRVALLGYVVGLALRARGDTGRARLAWTAGYVFFLAHIVCAFHYFHHWSHADAYDVTARRTAEVAGFAWGGGLYANYVFALLWGADIAWWWLSPASYARRPAAVNWAVQGFLGFIAFNATVVFGQGIIRWLGVAGCLFLALVYWHARRGR